MIICTLETKPAKGWIPGECAHCKATVFERLFTLDDAYNVWAGKCPLCKAINLLSMNHGLRGYSSAQMWLVLPTDEERDANQELPQDCPTSGACGKPADQHGSPAGEIYHQLFKADIK